MAGKNREIEITVEKYGISATLIDTPKEVMVEFEYAGKKVLIGLSLAFMFGDYRKKTIAVVESYIENMYTKVEKTKLFGWSLNEYEGLWGDMDYELKGTVYNSNQHADGKYVQIADVESYFIDWDSEELIATNKNGNRYYCDLKYLKFGLMEEAELHFEGYEQVKEKYAMKTEEVAMDNDSVLLQLSTFSPYYFHNMIHYQPESDVAEELERQVYPKICEDVVWICAKDSKINISYTAHFQNIEIQSCFTKGLPLFVENVGSAILFVSFEDGVIKLCPGERKQLSKANVEVDLPMLPKGRIYVNRPVIIK